MKYLISLAAVIFTVVLIDLAMFISTSKSGISTLPDYKKNYFQEQMNKVIHYFPRGYNTPDNFMGFDTAPNFPSTIFNITDGSFPIFSNDIGCFDHHSLSEIQKAKSYDYLAGDSFAWGYGNYENNIGSTYERVSGRFTVKCGIIHSGQRHQFEKFNRIVNLIGHYPKRVILTFYANDVANDFAFPHTTVIDGYEVDTLIFDSKNYKLVRRDLEKIQETIKHFTNPKERPLIKIISGWLKEHSISWNLIKFTYDKTFGEASGTIYLMNELINYRIDGGYENAVISKENRNAIEGWVADSIKNKYELIIVLIPPKLFHAQSMYYEGLRQYLSQKKIRHFDLSYPFWDARLRSEELYWLNDGHLKNEGNTFVGTYLAKQLSY